MCHSLDHHNNSVYLQNCYLDQDAGLLYTSNIGIDAVHTSICIDVDVGINSEVLCAVMMMMMILTPSFDYALYRGPQFNTQMAKPAQKVMVHGDGERVDRDSY